MDRWTYKVKFELKILTQNRNLSNVQNKGAHPQYNVEKVIEMNSVPEDRFSAKVRVD